MRLKTLAVSCAVALGPGMANAQPAAPVSRWDAAATIGSFSEGHAHLVEQRPWTHTFFKSLAAGYYWTDHLKTEVEAGWAGTAETYSSAPVDLPGVAPWVRIFTEHSFDDAIGSVAQTYQFGHNAMFHPFITGGIDIVRQRERIERPAQPIPAANGRSITLPAEETSSSSIFARPFFGAGFKAYISERAFFRTDLKLGMRDGIEQVVWKAGVGFDF